MADDVVYDDRMSGGDALMWAIERDPILRSTIIGLWLLDQAPDRARLLARAARALHHIPRLRQRVAVDPFSLAPPRWEVDPDFDLGFHLRFVRAPGGGALRDMLDFCQPIAMQSFDRDRPLWELYVVECLEGGRAALVLKVHHAISDGIGMVQMMGRLMETWRTPDPARVPRALPPLPEPQYKGIGERFLDALGWERATLVGNSWGGHLALHAAVSLNERLDGVLCVDPLGGVGDGGEKEFGAAMFARTPEDARDKAAALDARAMAGEGTPEDALESLRLVWPAYYADWTGPHEMPGSMRLSLEAYARTFESLHEELPRLTKSLPSVSTPVGFLAGAGSPMPVTASTETAAAIPGAWTEIVDDAGHFIWLEQPGRIRAAVDRLHNA
jgi:pimeloyl-ACP methyl ester carboxylesterase